MAIESGHGSSQMERDSIDRSGTHRFRGFVNLRSDDLIDHFSPSDIEINTDKSYVSNALRDE